MSKWYEAKIDAVQPIADDLTSITLDLHGTPLVGEHKLPGQHVKLSVPGVGEAPFAIASVPDAKSRRFDFLIKGGTHVADALSKLPRGATVRISKPTGGFPIDKAKGRTLLLFATGSGISAIRSVIEAIVAERSAYGD